jgi:hypothetical protein
MEIANFLKLLSYWQYELTTGSGARAATRT